MSHELLFEPLTIGPLVIKNRIMMTPNGPHLDHRRYVRYTEERARGGAGLLGVTAGAGLFHYPTSPGWFDPRFQGDFDMVWPDPLSADGRRFYDETYIPQFRELAEAGHRHGAHVVGQLHYHGASRSFDDLQVAMGPSDTLDEHLPEVPRVMDPVDLERLRDAYVNASLRVMRSGMDMVEVHAAHGYLMQQFLSPITNTRKDRYGGSLENRMRYLAEVIEAVKAAVGDFPVGLRIVGSEYTDGGIVPEDTAEVVRRLQHHLAYVNISGGTHSGYKQGPGPAYVSPWLFPDAIHSAAAAVVRRAVDLPVVVGGRITHPDVAERILADGQADVVGMVRALIADPEFPRKVREGRLEDITACLGCNECHFFHDLQRPIRCAVNASAGQEDRMAVVPAARPRRIVVVGGGPAGMEASRVAALRGHQVTLYERSDHLGGLLPALAADPSRAQFGRYGEHLAGQLRKLSVEIRLSTAVTPERLGTIDADVLVVATGSRPFVPDLPGIDSHWVTTALDVLRGRAAPSGRVVVVGGLDDHLPPLVMADLLAGRGAEVVLLSEHLVAGHQVEARTLGVLTKRLLQQGVELAPISRLVEVGSHTVVVENTFTGAVREIRDVEALVLCCGGRPVVPFSRADTAAFEEVHTIGDGLSPRRLLHATLDGARVGRMV
jgi:2,4-dienoyl-CoA reductase-like NADH-dependent reductase (Old Yellow Enzyme family)